MKRACFSSLCIIAMHLSACVSGPDYHLPPEAVENQPAARGPFLAGHEAVVTLAEPPQRWWQLFDDPRLDTYVQEALKANTDLRAADANLQRASYIVQEARASQTAETAITASTDATRTGGFTRQSPGTEFGFSLGISFGYPLDLAGGIKRAIETSSADAEKVEAVRDQTRVIVAAAVAGSYATICSANLSLAAVQYIVETQRQTLDLARRLQKGGRGTVFDVTRAQAAVDQSQAQVPLLQAERHAALLELTALMGRLPSDSPQDAQQCAAPPTLNQALPVGDGAALLRRRPDVRAAERSLAAATARIGVETANLYPQIRLGGALGFAGPTNGAVGDAFGGSIGPLLSWTWPNRLITEARMGEAGAAAKASAAEFDGVVINALRETEAAMGGYARQHDRLEALQRNRSDAAAAHGQAYRLFRFGRTNFLDVLTAQAALADSEVALAQARSDLTGRQIRLFLVLGGGWQS